MFLILFHNLVSVVLPDPLEIEALRAKKAAEKASRRAAELRRLNEKSLAALKLQSWYIRRSNSRKISRQWK